MERLRLDEIAKAIGYFRRHQITETTIDKNSEKGRKHIEYASTVRRAAGKLKLLESQLGYLKRQDLRIYQSILLGTSQKAVPFLDERGENGRFYLKADDAEQAVRILDAYLEIATHAIPDDKFKKIVAVRKAVERSRISIEDLFS